MHALGGTVLVVLGLLLFLWLNPVANVSRLRAVVAWIGLIVLIGSGVAVWVLQ